METQEQAFGQEGVERSLGYAPMEPVNPLPSDHSDVEVTTTSLEDAAAELTKERNERLGKPPGDTVREYKAETLDGKKLDESLTVSAEQAAADLTAARNREENYVELSEREELARAIDQLRSGDVTTESLGVESPQDGPVALDAQQSQPIQQAQPSDQGRMAKALQDNPQLLAGMQQVIEQEQARANYAFNQYADGLIQNGHVAAAALVSYFPELQNLQPHEIGTAIQVIGQRDPQRAQQIINYIERITPLVNQAVQVQTQRQQYQAAQYQAGWHKAAAQCDAEYDRWSRSQGVSPEEQRAIKEEVMAEFRRQGWNDQQIAQAYNSDPAMRGFIGQVQMHQAAAYRLQQKTMANVRRNKLDRTPPHVQRPGSPVERQSDSDHYLKRLEKPGQPLSAKEAAAFVVARRNAARR